MPVSEFGSEWRPTSRPKDQGLQSDGWSPIFLKEPQLPGVGKYCDFNLPIRSAAHEASPA